MAWKGKDRLLGGFWSSTNDGTDSTAGLSAAEPTAVNTLESVGLELEKKCSHVQFQVPIPSFTDQEFLLTTSVHHT